MTSAPPPVFGSTYFQILPLCTASFLWIFHHVPINILLRVIHQCNVINIKLPIQLLSDSSHIGWGLHQAIIVTRCLKHVQRPNLPLNTYHWTCLSSFLMSSCLKGKGGACARVGAGEGRGLGWLLGNITVNLSGKQSCRCPSYLFISQIINVYKKLLIALFTNDLWVLWKRGNWGKCVCTL